MKRAIPLIAALTVATVGGVAFLGLQREVAAQGKTVPVADVVIKGGSIAKKGSDPKAWESYTFGPAQMDKGLRQMLQQSGEGAPEIRANLDGVFFGEEAADIRVFLHVDPRSISSKNYLGTIGNVRGHEGGHMGLMSLTFDVQNFAVKDDQGNALEAGKTRNVLANTDKVFLTLQVRVGGMTFTQLRITDKVDVDSP